MLRSVEWSEYRLGDLFKIKTSAKKFDANKVVIYDCGKYPYIVRMGYNNGQKGFLNEDEAYLNDGNTISFGQDTATMYYQEIPYFTGDKIKILYPKIRGFGKRNAQFFLTSMKLAFSKFAWGSSQFNVSVLEEQKVMLPTKHGKIDFDFMENFIAELEAQRYVELEAQRYVELEAYLSVTGLKDTRLSPEEEQALAHYGEVKFKEFDAIEIFDVQNTSNILSRDIVENSGHVPYLCASAENNAVKSYIEYDEDLINEGNCVFIGGKTFVVSYQEEDFYSNDSHNLALYTRECERNKLNQLYLATCVYKSLGHKYSWGDSVSSTKIKRDKISLPIKDNRPDYGAMPTLISAIQKLVIRDVVAYSDKKLAAAKKVIEE